MLIQKIGIVIKIFNDYNYMMIMIKTIEMYILQNLNKS